MSEETFQRLFGYGNAFAHPVVVWITVGVLACLTIASASVRILMAAGKLTPSLHRELISRIRSWWVLAPMLLGPILLGAAWVILAIAVLSLWCYSEYARATGLFRHPSMSLCVVLGVLAVTFAIADNWYGLFAALPALGTVFIAAVGILADEPKGYIQRVALGGFGFLLFGVCLGHLGYFANDANYRPILLLLLLTVELNDVWAYLSGKLFGKRKLIPKTSPNKTIAGALGGLFCTTTLVAVLGHYVFQNGAVDTPAKLIGLGLLISIAGQLGDLMLSSIKRDIGIKDMGATIPGHGGLLDRFDSLILVAPAVFHYVDYFQGVGVNQATHILTG